MPEDTTTTATTTTDGGSDTTTTTTAAADAATKVVDTTKADDTTATTKTDATKTTDASKTDAKGAVPEAYEFKVAEGVALDDAAVGIVTPVLKELGVTQEGAQKLADAFIAIQTKQLEGQATQWLEASVADKEFGGKDFDANTKLAQATLAKFSTPEFKQFLEATGLGNHPEMLRTFVRIAKATAQDTHVSADSGGIEKTPGEVLFPTMTKK